MAVGVQKHGSVYLTVDTDVGISADPKYLYGLHIISGAIAGIVKLYNGTSASGTLYMQVTGISNDGYTIDFPEGFHFPGGIFVDIDANTTSVLLSVDEGKI